MIRTYKYRLRPYRKQIPLLDRLLSQAQTIYNAALEQRKTLYENTRTGIGYSAQCVYFNNFRKNNIDTFDLLNVTSMQQLLRRLDKAFAAFFRRVKSGEKPGYPRFKSWDRFHSVEYTYGDGCKLRVDANGKHRFYVQHIGEMKIIYHRAIPDEATIKHVVIKRKNERWYVCLSVEFPDADQYPSNNSAIGIDIGLLSLIATSNGDTIDNPRWLRHSFRQLRTAQRRLARRKKGSNGRCIAKKQVSVLHEKIANQRRDFWHKTTRVLVSNHSLIAIEDLNLAFMNKNRHLALSSYDAGLGMFTQFLAYKVEETGCQLIAVNPAYTSQVCSSCGSIVEKDLSVRIHVCPECNLEIDRDVNAARNILTKALLTLGSSVCGATWADTPCVPQEAVCFS